MQWRVRIRGFIETYLEALVLQHALDGGILPRRRELGLEDDAEGAIADNLALGVLHLLGLAGQAVLDLLTDDFCTEGQHRTRHCDGDRRIGSTYLPFSSSKRPTACSGTCRGVCLELGWVTAQDVVTVWGRSDSG